MYLPYLSNNEQLAIDNIQTGSVNEEQVLVDTNEWFSE